MKNVNWYFEGWKKKKETDASGHVKTKWEYSGVNYRFHMVEKHLRNLKMGYFGLVSVLTVFWVVFSLIPCSGRETAAYAGAPWFLMILPFMYLYMGLYGLLRSGYIMTYRDVRAGYYRIRSAKWMILVLQVISLAGEIIYLIINHSEIQIGGELLWIAGICGSIGCNTGIMRLQRQFPPCQIPSDQ